MCLGIPGEVVEVGEPGDGLLMGKVSFGGTCRDVCLAYTPEVRVGDYVLVHVGFAISMLDEQEALEIFDYLRQIEALGEAEPGPAASGELASSAGDAANPGSRKG
jgi:hydrogenase expression/formation protein HypC